MPTPTELAEAFVAVINEWLTNDELLSIRRRNAVAKESVCHSHDFCDANQAMLDAGEKLGINVLDDIELTNAAWDIAKDGGFRA